LGAEAKERERTPGNAQRFEQLRHEPVPVPYVRAYKSTILVGVLTKALCCCFQRSFKEHGRSVIQGVCERHERMNPLKSMGSKVE
jgi:hypothetical protein